MSRIQDILAKAERDGTARRLQAAPGAIAAPATVLTPHFDGASGQHESRRRVRVGDRLHGVEEQVPSDEPQHGRDIFAPDRLAGERDHLIQLALSVPHAAFGIPGDELQ